MFLINNKVFIIFKFNDSPFRLLGNRKEVLKLSLSELKFYESRISIGLGILSKQIHFLKTNIFILFVHKTIHV